METSKINTLLSNTIIYAIGNILVKLISFFLMPLYTSQLTTEQYGIAELLNNSMEILLPIATLCIIDAAFRFSIDKDSNHKEIMSTSINLLIKSYIVMIILCTIFFITTGYKYTYYFLLLFVSTTLHKLFSQFSRGIGHIKRFALSGVINAIVLVIMNIILILIFNGGIESYIISLIISHFIASLYSLFASKLYLFIDLKCNNSKLLRSMLKFSIPNIPNMISWWINNVSSRYIILWFCGAGLAGLYTAASKLPSMINIFTTIFQQAWQYSSSKEIDNEGSNIFFSEVFNYFSGFIFIVCSGLIMIIPYLSLLILHGDFYEGWKFVPLLLVSATLGAISSYFGTFYTAIKNNVMAMVSTSIGAIINMILNFFLIPFIGVYGALIAGVISYMIISIIRMIDTKKFVSLKINYKMLFLRIIIVLIQAIFIMLDTVFTKQISIICFLTILLIHRDLICKIINRILNKKKGE